MLSVAEVAALQCPDALARAIVSAGCARIWLCMRREIWCLVDAEDYFWLSEHGWNVGGHSAWKHYAKRNEGPARLTIYLHREVCVRAQPRDNTFLAKHHAHHLNGQSLDCRRAKSRLAHRLGECRNPQQSRRLPVARVDRGAARRGLARGRGDSVLRPHAGNDASRICPAPRR